MELHLTITIIAIASSTVLSAIVLQLVSRFAYNLYYRFKYGLPEDHKALLNMAYLLHWAINCAREALPQPPPKSSNLWQKFEGYEKKYIEFQREMDSLSNDVTHFTIAWVLDRNSEKEKTPNNARQDALEIVESIEETLRHFETTSHKFQATMLEINPDSDIKTPLIAAKSCVYLAKENLSKK